MDKIIRYAAYVACVAQIIFVIVLASGTTRNGDFFIALSMLVSPLLCLVALYGSPDLEERRLRRQVAKLRLQAELQELEAKTKTK